MEIAGTEISVSAIIPDSAESGPASMASAPEINVCTWAACLAITLAASFPMEPAGITC